MKRRPPKWERLEREAWKKHSWGFENENWLGHWGFQLTATRTILTFLVNQICISNLNIYLTQKLRTNLLSGAERAFWIQSHAQKRIQSTGLETVWAQESKGRQSKFFSPQCQYHLTTTKRKEYIFGQANLSDKWFLRCGRSHVWNEGSSFRTHSI